MSSYKYIKSQKERKRKDRKENMEPNSNDGKYSKTRNYPKNILKLALLSSVSIPKLATSIPKLEIFKLQQIHNSFKIRKIPTIPTKLLHKTLQLF